MIVCMQISTRYLVVAAIGKLLILYQWTCTFRYSFASLMFTCINIDYCITGIKRIPHISYTSLEPWHVTLGTKLEFVKASLGARLSI